MYIQKILWFGMFKALPHVETFWHCLKNGSILEKLKGKLKFGSINSTVVQTYLFEWLQFWHWELRLV